MMRCKSLKHELNHLAFINKLCSNKNLFKLIQGNVVKKFLYGSLGVLIHFSTAIGHAGQIEKLYLYQKMQQSIKTQDDSSKSYWFSQIIDHRNPEGGVFKQRYFVNETFGQDKNAPVFFYICGESACDGRVLHGALENYAKKFNAKLVALEHRYYGQSQPADNLSTDNLKYLSTDFALQDLANFQKSISRENNWTGPWVAFGGSYPGSLAAFYRLRYPELVIGALASSAPVLARENFIEYDQHVTRVVGEACAGKIRDVVAEIEHIFASEDEARVNSMKSQFHAREVQDPIDFLYLVADVASAAVQYGFHQEFCNSLDVAPDPLSGYAVFTHILLAKMGTHAQDMTAEGAMSEKISDHDKGVGARQWMYQSCTEYGYWQNAYPDTLQSTRSAKIDLQYSRNICKRLFGIEAPPATDVMNSTFYLSLLNPMVSHIYLTNGMNDPWSNLSITHENGNDYNENLSYMNIIDAAHCDDLRTPSEQDSIYIIKAREKMMSLLATWLGMGHDDSV